MLFAAVFTPNHRYAVTDRPTPIDHKQSANVFHRVVKAQVQVAEICVASTAASHQVNTRTQVYFGVIPKFLFMT